MISGFALNNSGQDHIIQKNYSDRLPCGVQQNLCASALTFNILNVHNIFIYISNVLSDRI